MSRPTGTESARAPIPLYPGSPAVVNPARLSPGRHVPPDPSSYYLGRLGWTGPIPRLPGREPRLLELLRFLRDLDPDTSQATWNFLRLGNPGHTTEVRDSAGTRLPDAEAWINTDLAPRIWVQGGGGADVLVDTLHLTLLTFGGAGLEAEVTEELDDIVDFHPFPPTAIEFRWGLDAKGVARQFMFPAYSVPGQQTLSLNPNQVFYQPLDADTDDPYGRSPMIPAVAAVLALAALIQDQGDVAYVHGVGRTDITIDEEQVIATAPPQLTQAGREQDLADYVESVRAEVQRVVDELAPIQTLVHYKSITVNRTSPGGQGIDVKALMDQQERRVATGTKSLPLLLGMGTDGGYGSIQWGVYVKGLEALQRRSKRLLEAGYNASLRIRGIAGTAHVTYNAIRETDRQIEATADATEQTNAQRRYEQGLDSFKTYSLAVTGHLPEGPAPPTDADKYQQGLGVATAPTPAASSSTLDQQPGVEPGTTPPAAAPPPVPGTDAGLTAQEGAALGLTAPAATRGAP